MKYRVQFETGTEIVPSNLFGPAHRRLVPHIYTEAEIGALLDAAAQLRPVTGLRLRPRTYSTLFGLLASTGLRISEALALTPTNVDLPGESLTVRETKFRKSRLVPLHPTTVAALSQYAHARRRRVSDRRIETFFVSDQGTPLGDRIVHHTFARLRAQLGWIGRGDYALPRVHDLRQHAGSRLMPASVWEVAFPRRYGQIWSLQVGIIRLSFSAWLFGQERRRHAGSLHRESRHGSAAAIRGHRLAARRVRDASRTVRVRSHDRSCAAQPAWALQSVADSLSMRHSRAE
jgi:hypothetical protein